MGASQNLAILGSTGSVGLSTLDVVSRHPAMFRIVALTARNQTDVLFEQCRRYKPALAVMLEPAAAEDLERRIRRSGLECAVLSVPLRWSRR
jgi:1-deoxy-D-xylulose-5-phosphate reductoisomerase